MNTQLEEIQKLLSVLTAAAVRKHKALESDAPDQVYADACTDVARIKFAILQKVSEYRYSKHDTPA